MISADLFIVPSENQTFGTMEGVDAIAADGFSASVPGFPPLTHYYLSSGPHPGAVVLATGPKTIFFIRNVSPPGQTATPHWHDTEAPTSQDRLDFIAALLDTQSQPLIIKSRESRTIIGRDGLSVEKESAEFRADILRRYMSLVAGLVGKRLLTQGEAAALPQPRIVVTIHDKRGS